MPELAITGFARQIMRDLERRSRRRRDALAAAGARRLAAHTAVLAVLGGVTTLMAGVWLWAVLFGSLAPSDIFCVWNSGLVLLTVSLGGVAAVFGFAGRKGGDR